MEVDLRARIRLTYAKWCKLGGTTKTFLVVVFIQFLILEGLAIVNLAQVATSDGGELKPGP